MEGNYVAGGFQTKRGRDAADLAQAPRRGDFGRDALRLDRHVPLVQAAQDIRGSANQGTVRSTQPTGTQKIF